MENRRSFLHSNHTKKKKPMKSKPSLLATGIFLAAGTAGYGQPVITNQPQPLAVAPGT